MNKIPLIKPYITNEVKAKVCEVLDSGYLTEGPVTAEFEKACREYIGCKHAIAMTSCTTGLETALRCLGVGAGDEVIIPDYTFPATADAVALVGAKIVIVDVNPKSMLIDYIKLEESITDKTKAIIPVSLFGNPLDYEKLNFIKQKHGVYIIEDAACALGSEYKNIKTGNLADISVFSFHPRKFITTGEGGLITTNNPEWAEQINSFKHFGTNQTISREKTMFERIGTNYKLSNVLAAIGLVQMKHIDQLLDKRRILSERYYDLLNKYEKIKFPETTREGINSYQSFCIFIDDRDYIMKTMRSKGVEVQIGTYSLHMHPAFRPSSECLIKDYMIGSRYACDHCLVLPLFHEMTDKEQDIVVDTLLSLIDVNPCAE